MLFRTVWARPQRPRPKSSLIDFLGGTGKGPKNVFVKIEFLYFFAGFLDSQRRRCGRVNPWDCRFHLRRKSHSMSFSFLITLRSS